MLSESSTLRLATQLECLPLLLGDRSPVAIKRRPASGKWSAHENLAHLARYHEVFIERIQRILIEERPHLARYRAEDDPEWPQWAAMPTDEVMRKLKALRGELIKAVTHLLTCLLLAAEIEFVAFILGQQGHEHVQSLVVQ